MDARSFPDDITMLKAWVTHWAEDAGRGLPCTLDSLADATKRAIRVEKLLAEQVETLEACEAYFDNRSDVSDGDYGQPEPNEEMRLLTMVRASLQSLQTKEEA